MIEFTAHNQDKVYINPQHIIAIHEIGAGEADGESKIFTRIKAIDGTDFDLDEELEDVVSLIHAICIGEQGLDNG